MPADVDVEDGGGAPRVGIAGAGAVAGALAAELVAAGLPVSLWARDAGARRAVAAASGAAPVDGAELLAGADAVVLAVSDHAVGEVARAVAAGADPARRPVLLHTGGARSGAEAMAGSDLAPFERGSLHPLVAVPRPARLEGARGRFGGMPFAVEGVGAAARAMGERLVRALGGRLVAVGQGDKLRYHALATMVATGVVALVDRAARGMAPDGASREDLRAAYGALGRSAAENAAAMAGREALTGALARGDAELIARHRSSLEDDPGALALYDAVMAAARAMLGPGEGAGEGAGEGSGEDPGEGRGEGDQA